MARQRISERGEGKIGCIVSLLVFVILGAAAIKIAPEYLANDEIMDTAIEWSSRAGVRPIKEIELQIQSKGKDKGIAEIMTPGAITITTSGGQTSGTCTIRVNYTRTIDFFGVYSTKMTFDKTISRPYMDAR